jgi:hypothetical protein
MLDASAGIGVSSESRCATNSPSDSRIVPLGPRQPHVHTGLNVFTLPSTWSSSCPGTPVGTGEGAASGSIPVSARSTKPCQSPPVTRWRTSYHSGLVSSRHGASTSANWYATHRALAMESMWSSSSSRGLPVAMSDIRERGRSDTPNLTAGKPSTSPITYSC